MVNTALGGENHRSVLEYVYLLLTELVGTQSVNADKLTKIDFDAMLLSNVRIG